MSAIYLLFIALNTELDGRVVTKVTCLISFWRNFNLGSAV